MHKSKLLFLLLAPAIGFSQISILDQIKNEVKKVIPINLPSATLSTTDIASGLKEALNKGIEKQVTKLTAVDGFYKNEMVKILLPDELKKVDKALRKIGLSSLADKGLSTA